MNSQEKKDLCVTTLATATIHNGCPGVSIFPECTRCKLSYLNSNKNNTQKLTNNSITDRK